MIEFLQHFNDGLYEVLDFIVLILPFLLCVGLALFIIFIFIDFCRHL